MFLEIGLPAPRLRDFMHLAGALGHIYWRVPAPVDATFETAFEVDVELLAQTILHAINYNRCI